jgi:hypothetical protein
MSRRLSLLCAALAAGALALGYFQAGLHLWVLPILGGGLLWVLGAARGVRWISPAGVVACALGGAWGLGLAVGAGWMLAALVAAITSWDLDRFARVLAAAGLRVEGAAQIERRHLQRLALVDLVSLLLGASALLLKARLEFLVLVLLILVAAWGMSQAVVYLRRESR